MPGEDSRITVGTAVILAAGSGSRFAESGITNESNSTISSAHFSKVPKQFHLLSAKPILLYSLEAFARLSFVKHLVLVIPANWNKEDFIHHLGIEPNTLFTSVSYVNGGDSRQISVANALSFLLETQSKNSIVFIHDGVRPFVASKDIQALYTSCQKDFCATLSMEMTETICDVEKVVYLDRTKLRTIQTPQAFHPDVWHSLPSLLKNEKITFTDETMAASHLGFRIKYIASNSYNRKITKQEDLKIMETLLPLFLKGESSGL